MIYSRRDWTLEDRPSACMGQLRCAIPDVPEGSSRLTAQTKKAGRNSTDLSFVFLSLPVHPWSKPVDGVSRAVLSEAHQQSR